MQQVHAVNTVTESMSGGPSSKQSKGSASSSICGDPTVASNHNEHSGQKRSRDQIEGP